MIYINVVYIYMLYKCYIYSIYIYSIYLYIYICYIPHPHHTTGGEGDVPHPYMLYIYMHML